MMKIIDVRDNDSDNKKIVFGFEEEYITNDSDYVESEYILICSSEDNEYSIQILKSDISNLIKALQLAEQWEY